MWESPTPNIIEPQIAGVAELADALDLGSSTFGVQVQLLSPAPFNIMKDILTGMSFLLFFNGSLSTGVGEEILYL